MMFDGVLKMPLKILVTFTKYTIVPWTYNSLHFMQKLITFRS